MISNQDSSQEVISQATRLFREAIIRLSNRSSIKQAVISSVDKENNTCTITFEGQDYEGIPLGTILDNSSIEIYPAVNTPCEIYFFDGDDQVIRLLKFQSSQGVKIQNITEQNINFEININISSLSGNISNIDISSEKISLNGGNEGGLVLVKPLSAGLEKNNQILESLLRIINGPAISEPGNGSPSAFQAALKGVLSSSSVGDFSSIENTSIIQGI